MRCVKCGHEIPEGVMFCENCGEPVQSSMQMDYYPGYQDTRPPVRCRRCGSYVSPDDTFCQNCGSRIGGNNRWIYVVLAGVAVAVAAGLAFAFFLLRDKREDALPDSVTTEITEDETEDIAEEADKDKGQDPAGSADETPAAAPTTAQLMTYAPDTRSLVSPSIIGAQASSTIQQSGKTNDPILLFDGRDDTNWEEGVAGYGIGENVSFSFDGTYSIKYIGFKLGNWKDERYYAGNAKPKTMTLILGDFSGQVTFTGQKMVEWVELSNGVDADSMRVEINDVYPGTQWEDTCITEIILYGDKK